MPSSRTPGLASPLRTRNLAKPALFTRDSFAMFQDTTITKATWEKERPKRARELDLRKRAMQEKLRLIAESRLRDRLKTES